MQERQAPSPPGASSAPDSGTGAGTTTSATTALAANTTTTTTATPNTKAAPASALPWYNPHGWSLETFVGNGQCNQLLLAL